MARFTAILSGALLVLCCLGAVSGVRCNKVHTSGRSLLALSDAICRGKYVIDNPETFDAKCPVDWEIEEADGLDKMCYAKCGDGYTVYKKDNTKCIQNCQGGYTAVGDFCKPTDLCKGKVGTYDKNQNKCCPPCKTVNGQKYQPYNDTCSSPCPKDFNVVNSQKCKRTRDNKVLPRTTTKRGCIAPNPTYPRIIKTRDSQEIDCDSGFTAANGYCLAECPSYSLDLTGYELKFDDNLQEYRCLLPEAACGSSMFFCSKYCIADGTLPSGPSDSCPDLEAVLDTIDGQDANGSPCIKQCTLDTR